jgi:hypothetical protein
MWDVRDSPFVANLAPFSSMCRALYILTAFSSAFSIVVGILWLILTATGDLAKVFGD